MWGFTKSEDRRNSASIVELRRAAKLALSRNADLQKSPGLRRANSCKEGDDSVPRPPSHARAPYPNYYDNDFQRLGHRTGSDGEIKLHKQTLKNCFKTPLNNTRNYDSREYSSLNYSINGPVIVCEQRSLKDLRNVDSCPSIHVPDDDYDKRSRNNSYNSSRQSSLTDIPEDIKGRSSFSSHETTSLFTPSDNCSLASYDSCQYYFKLMLVGDSNVGKTCLITKFKDGIFLAGTFIPTVGIDSKTKTISVDDNNIHMQIWDTAGQPRFRSLLRTYCKPAQAVILQYDVRNRVSFINIRDWLNTVRENSREDVLLLLVGNKCDLDEKERAVSREEGEALALQLNLPFIETSAKAGTNVTLVFTAIAKQLVSLASVSGPSFNIREYVKQNDASMAGFCSMCRIC